MLRPTRAILRWNWWAISVAILMRWMDDEKQETKSLRRAWRKISSNLGRTMRSLGV